MALAMCEALSFQLSNNRNARIRHSSSSLHAKRNKNKREGDKLNQWYESVDDDATPDEVFWEEMDRQSLFNEIGQESERDPYAEAESSMPLSSSSNGGSKAGMNSRMNTMMGSGAVNTAQFGGINTATAHPTRKSPTMDQQKSAEATLSEYTLYQVDDNWLDERLQAQMDAMRMNEDENLSIEEETRRLEEQLEALPDGYGDQRDLFADTEEPWDFFGSDVPEEVDLDRQGIRQVTEPPIGTSLSLSLL
jgi:hypothetical protein